MKKLLFLLPLLLSLSANAQTLYVTDNLEIMVRSGQGSNHRITGTLKSGKPVKVIEKSSTGYSNVSYGKGKQGWVLSRLLSKSTAAKTRLAISDTSLSKLKTKHALALEELTLLKQAKNKLEEQTKNLTKQSSSANRTLETLQRTSANAVKTLEERNQLQERVVTIERDLQTLKRENDILKNSSAQDWFLVGAGVLSLGLLLGFLLPKISWRKKPSYSSSF